MPFFRAMVEVSGFLFDVENEEQSAMVGYYCTVPFHAPDASNDARILGAIEAAKYHWTRNGFTRRSRSAGPPAINVDSSWPISFWGYIWHRYIHYNAGATFYTRDE